MPPRRQDRQAKAGMNRLSKEFEAELGELFIRSILGDPGVLAATPRWVLYSQKNRRGNESRGGFASQAIRHSPYETLVDCSFSVSFRRLKWESKLTNPLVP